ncbi:hypothetical protein [Luteolibacter sp. AS25]|uniref:hypothetical protein n=1 Tax=Luteolibacter sp. AS25 TaxID=3135776 RepID=UPI00398AA43C
MKLFMTLLGMVAAGILGYSLEPELRFQLTGVSPEAEKAPEPKHITIEIGDSSANKIDPATFPVEQLPKKVLLKSDAEIADTNSGIKMTITAGNQVDLIRLDGQDVVISPGSATLEGRVPYSQTDLLEQLGTIRMAPRVGKMPDAETEVEVEPKVEADPKVDVVPEMNPVPQPEPQSAGSNDVVEIMKASIKAGQIKEFSFDQVSEWQENEGDEVIDGETYRTGVASYEGETVFGIKTLKAKALIRNGKLERWVYEKSGMEIK